MWVNGNSSSISNISSIRNIDNQGHVVGVNGNSNSISIISSSRILTAKVPEYPALPIIGVFLRSRRICENTSDSPPRTGRIYDLSL